MILPLGLVLMAFLQSPGGITFDTDLGLSLNPAHLLHRAFHLWSSEAGFGGVGDQTYGFLIPMGPFFALGHLLSIPDWVVERLWSGLVLVVAYDGARRLVRRMISPSPLVTAVAGLAWALSPRMLTVIGPFSSEAMPVALAPWLLLPLVLYVERDVRRAAWVSGLVVLALGAVNAAATLAVLPLPFLYLLTRTTPWGMRLRSIAWWSLGVLLGALWWIGPLLLLGSYSPPFTDWVESARTTTDPVSVLAALRGATDWVAYVPEGKGGFWPAAWDLATHRGLAVLTIVVAVAGLAGLVSKRMPERRFLIITALLGFFVLTIGHQGTPEGPVASGWRDLLNGPLVPFRNVYKFDPVLRLPLLLGFAHLVSRFSDVRFRVFRPVAPLVAVSLVAVCALPAWQGELRPGPSFTAVPSWWNQAADYIASDGVAGRTLVVPEATTGRYTWGRTIGEPLEALAHSPWAVRDQVPLTQAGNTRVVDAVEAVLASGRGSTALAAVLARSGVGQLLVRNDLDRNNADGLPPVRVRAALERSPGISLLKDIGPVQPASSTVDGGIDLAPSALEVWKVEGSIAVPHTAPLSGVAALSGGPEDLLSLLEAGALTSSEPTVLASQIKGAWQGPRIITDGLQRRERTFGEVHDALGPLLTPTDSFRAVRGAHDLLPNDVAPQTTASYDGLVDVTASSSAAYPDAFGRLATTVAPSAAIDGDASTSWNSAGLTRAVGQWLQVQRTAATDVDSITLTMVSRALFGPTVTSVRVTTEAGSSVVPIAGTENPQVIPLPTGSWKRLRITVASIAGPSRIGVVGIRELVLPGAATTRSVVTASDLPKGAQPAVLSFHTDDPVEPCIEVDQTQRCNPSSATISEETAALDRTFTLPSGSLDALTGTVLPSNGLGLARLLRPSGDALVATASSSLGSAVGASAAVDGDAGTSWIANPGEALPALGVTWPKAQRIDELVLVHAEQPESSAPAMVHIHSAAGDRDAAVSSDGVVTFAPLTTRSITLTFPALHLQATTSSVSGLTTHLPVGIAEVRLPQVSTPDAPLPDSAVTGSFCGFGPNVIIDGQRYTTQVRGTIGDVRGSRPLTFTLCGLNAAGVLLTPGTHRIRAEQTGEFQVRSLLLTPSTVTAVADASRSVTIRSWGQVHRSVDVAAGVASLLIVPEAQNAGWRATMNGHVLTAMTVDGWQQAWVVPAGQGGRVALDYTPDGPYRIALLVGAVAIVVLLVLVLLAVRRPARSSGHVATRPSWIVPLVFAAVLCGLGGGLVCLAGLAVGLAAVVLRRSWVAASLVWVLPLVAGFLVLVEQHRVTLAAQSGTVVSALCLLAIGCLASLLAA